VSRVLVLTGLELEAAALARHLGVERVAGARWPHFRAGALEIAAVGLGAHALATRTAALTDPALVVSAGICGALARELDVGSLVVPETVVGAEGQVWETAQVAGLTRRGRLLVVGRVIGTVAEKSRLRLATGACAVDMESAAILGWARARGVPAAVVRAVSDAATRAVPADLAAAVASDGAVRPLAAVRVALARPAAVADALALRAATATALRAVATILARFTTNPPRVAPPLRAPAPPARSKGEALEGAIEAPSD
jgi:adenosylhomocysteine nucleosidase